MKLEVVVVPVAEVDRANSFYRVLGWREEAGYSAGADFRVVQLTPRGSPCWVVHEHAGHLGPVSSGMVP